MIKEQNQDTVITQPTARSLPEDAENLYPTRDAMNNKLDVADLFNHFTASIIQENTLFTR
ncbi:MAG: hypothetical protein ABJB86_23355 [Bacteroidota bacterium]